MPQAAGDTTVQVLYEDFEGTFPGLNWTVSDLNGTSGPDLWGSSNYRASAGNRSAWSAASGNQTILWQADTILPANATNITFLQDDFENGSFAANWTASDSDSTYGDDYWGESSVRVHSGSTSIWSAQVGYNDDLSDSNVNVSSYDDYMDTIMSRSINVSGAPNGSLVFVDYWYWLDAESCCDWLAVSYDNGSGWVDVGAGSGSSNGWLQGSAVIPNDTTSIGFHFYSDYSVIYEGAYIDDLVIRTGPPPPQTGPFGEDFESGTTDPNWSVADFDSSYGSDRWGVSTARSNSGTSSLWCAQFGDNSELGGTNAANSAYDDGMNTIVWRDINNTGLTNFTTITFSFWYWLDSEQGFDYFSAGYYADDQWNALNSLDGNSNGWVFATFTLPNDTTKVGFDFTSDSSFVQEGAYIDDVQFFASRAVSNAALRTYDTAMNSTMVRSVDLSAYAVASLNYSYWLATDSPNDTLEAMFQVGNNWTYADRHSGSSSGWQSSNISIPTNATRFGFRFVSDSVGRAEGAYIDEVRIWGTYYPLNCTASINATSGTERSTRFSLSGNASDGLRPYTWSWNVSDGNASTSQGLLHVFNDVGTYTATLTVRDSAGHSCSSQVGPIDITHDLSAILISPAASSVVEGQGAAFSAADRLGHPYPVNWSLAPSSCGALDNSTGINVEFSSSADAGGTLCNITAAVGSTQVSIHVLLVHDTSQIDLTPATGSIVEDGQLTFSATDAHGHGLDFNWSATCGAASLARGPSMSYTAPAVGGVVCTVSAAYAGDTASADATILHDLSQMVVGPTVAFVVEGSEVALSVADAKGHAIVADWTAPAACGALSAGNGSLVVFNASTDAGGMTCIVTAGVGGVSDASTLNIVHDLTQLTILPKQANLTEGMSLNFQALDRFAHALNVSWSVAPSTCGVMSPEVGTSSSFTARAAAAAARCTITAVAQGVSLAATVDLVHGLPARLVVNSTFAEGEAGTKVGLTSAVYDAAGHSLSAVARTWSSSCGLLEVATGSANSLTLPQDGAGTTCLVTVTAANGSVTGYANISVLNARPFTVTIRTDPDPVPPGETTVGLTAKVTDAFGNEVTTAVIHWTASCGQLSATNGTTTVLTLPAGGGKACKVTASTQGQSTTFEGTATIVSPATSDLVMPLVIAVAVAAAAAVLFLVRRRRKPTEQEAPTQPGT